MRQQDCALLQKEGLSGVLPLWPAVPYGWKAGIQAVNAPRPHMGQGLREEGGETPEDAPSV